MRRVVPLNKQDKFTMRENLALVRQENPQQSPFSRGKINHDLLPLDLPTRQIDVGLIR